MVGMYHVFLVEYLLADVYSEFNNQFVIAVTSDDRRQFRPKIKGEILILTSCGLLHYLQ